jgi:5'-3' exonuclease
MPTLVKDLNITAYQDGVWMSVTFNAVATSHYLRVLFAGTVFMTELSDYLRDYILMMMANDPTWRHLAVSP